MSNHDIIKERNKILFESRLQINQNSGLKMNQITIKSNKNKFKNKTNLYLFNTDIYSSEISQSKKKNELTGIENSLNNFNKNNNYIWKKRIKINKNRNTNNYVSLNNKSNLIIKDISFFHTKNSTIKNNIQIININKKVKTNVCSSNKKREKKLYKKRGNKFKDKLNIVKRNTNISQNKYSKSYIHFTYANYLNIINNNKQTISKTKNALLSNTSNINNQSLKKRNGSSIKKNTNNDKSFLKQKIRIIKKKDKLNLNNTNRNLNHSKNNKSQRGKFMNKTGKNNSKTFINNCNKKSMNNTYRYLFIKRGKKSCINLNYNTSKNNLSSLNNRRKISERNFIIKNFNKLLLNPKKNKITQKKNNENKTISTFKNKNDVDKNSFINQIKINKTKKEINAIKTKNNYDITTKINKYIDKKEELFDDFNIKSTKTNDEPFTESKNEKIEESSIEEESGILSMNDIEDIIVYNNMKNINKIDNYLFHKNDYNNFIEKYHNKICNLFFDNNNNIKEGKKKQIYSGKKQIK